MAFMDLTYVVKQTCQKSHSWPLFCEKVHICHCKANGFFLMIFIRADIEDFDFLVFDQLPDVVVANVYVF